MYANKFDNLEEMDNFLETYSLPKLNQEEIGQMNSQSLEMKLNMSQKHSLQIEVQDQMASQENSTKHTKRNILLKFFQKVEEEGTLPKTFSDASITLIPKADKVTTKKENYRPISLTQKFSTKF